MNRSNWFEPSMRVTLRSARRRGLWMAVLLPLMATLAGCGGGRNSGNTASGDSLGADTFTVADPVSDGERVDAPSPESRWGYPPLAASDIPPAYLQEWARAENRATCAPIAPAALGAGADARPRAATFAGGWGVAYDMPDLRSAFGVAGAGVTTSGEIYSGWSNRRDWPDGSFADYGPEGGNGPNQVAYLRVAGEGCLYNIWSRLGIAHLELLLDQLRRVTVPPA